MHTLRVTWLADNEVVEGLRFGWRVALTKPNRVIAVPPWSSTFLAHYKQHAAPSEMRSPLVLPHLARIPVRGDSNGRAPIPSCPCVSKVCWTEVVALLRVSVDMGEPVLWLLRSEGLLLVLVLLRKSSLRLNNQGSAWHTSKHQPLQVLTRACARTPIRHFTGSRLAPTGTCGFRGNAREPVVYGHAEPNLRRPLPLPRTDLTQPRAGLTQGQV